MRIYCIFRKYMCGGNALILIIGVICIFKYTSFMKCFKSPFYLYLKFIGGTELFSKFNLHVAQSVGHIYYAVIHSGTCHFSNIEF